MVRDVPCVRRPRTTRRSGAACQASGSGSIGSETSSSINSSETLPTTHPLSTDAGVSETPLPVSLNGAGADEAAGSSAGATNQERPAAKAGLVATWWPRLVLFAILAVALALRLYGFNWDSSSEIHPDERAISGWVDRLAFPRNPWDLFNAQGSWNPGWNPVAKTHDISGFNYGSLPLYLIYFFSHLLSWLGGIFPWWASWKDAAQDPDRILAGRILSAFADTVTVFLVYRIGSRLAGIRTGLYAAALAAFTVLSIQLSHFTTVDVLLTTFCTGAVLTSIALFTHGRPRDYIMVGIWVAAAVATKASAAPLLSVVAAAHFWRQWRLHDLGDWRTVGMAALAAVSGAIALFIFQPFTYLDWPTFWSGVQYQSDLARGTQFQFYTLKWAGTTALIYPLQQLTYFSLGLPLALLAYAGMLYEGVRVFTARRNAGALVACFVIVYFFAAGTLYMKYLRYMDPIVPSLCVMGAIFVSAVLRGRVWLTGQAARVGGFALGAVVLILTVGYGLSYINIYRQPLTRIQATCWMFSHIPQGARIVQDGIDETLPVGGNQCKNPQPIFTLEPSLSTYDPETLAKVNTMAATLSQTNWYIITSRRSMDTFLPQPTKYPFTSRFYHLLFAPNHPLGFTLVYHTDVTPRLGPWSLNESGANQNFNEYDHPPVWIFKNTGNLSPTALINDLTANGTIGPPSPYAVPPKSLLLSPKDIATNQHAPSYGQMFPPDSFPMQHPIIAWLVMMEALGLLTLPLSMRLFGKLADGGWLLAKTTGILFLSYFAWILASLHIAEYSRGEIALGLVLIAAVSLLWGVRVNDLPQRLRERRSAVLVAEGAFLIGFAAFVYIRMLYPDLWHIISGGEKTMDMSFLNAIVRSRVMPPLDPWFSGGYLNYYYYGHFTVATLLKLAAITPAVAVNLAIPTFFALALGTAVVLGHTICRRIPFGLLAGLFTVVCGNLAAGEQLVGDLQQASPLANQMDPVTSAGSTVFFLGGIINVVSFSWSLVTGIIRGTIAAILGLIAVLTHHAALPGYVFNNGWPWNQTRVIDNNNIVTEFPFWTFLFADPHAHMWDIPFALCVLGLVFTFVHGGGAIRREDGDRVSLLPGWHLVQWPLIGVIVGAVGPTNLWDLATMFGASGFGLLTGLLLTGRALKAAIVGAVWRLALVAGFALGLYLPFYSHFQSFYSSIGLTLVRHQTNLGDFTNMFGFFLFILGSYLGFAVLRETYTGRWLRRQTRVALFSLYHWDRHDDLERLYRLARRMAGPHALRGAYHAVVPEARRAVFGFGAVMLVLLIFQYWAFAAIVALLGTTWIGLSVGDRKDEKVRVWQPLLERPAAVTLSILGVCIILLLIAHYLVLALLLVMIGATVLLMVDQRAPKPPTVYCLHLAILVGLGIAAAGEIVYVKDFYDGGPLTFRNNTLFKLYEEAWLMMAVGSAGALARLGAFAGVLHPLGQPTEEIAEPVPTLEDARVEAEDETPASLLNWGRIRGGTRVWVILFSLLFTCVEVSPLRTTPLRVAERNSWSMLQGNHIGLTLDGMAFVKYIYPDDYAAIQWLNANVTGSPVILQTTGGGYRDFGARVTMFTGLPSVVNWPGEAGQQRYSGQLGPNNLPYPDEVNPRVTDVDLIYNTSDSALALQLLHQYHVSLIFIGHIERFGDPEDTGNLRPYTQSGLAKFPAMAATGTLTRVYPPAGSPVTPTSTVIYKVVR